MPTKCHHWFWDRALALLHPNHTKTHIFAILEVKECTERKNGCKLRDCYYVTIFQATWAKNFDLLRVIAVHKAMTIKFYVVF